MIILIFPAGRTGGHTNDCTHWLIIGVLHFVRAGGDSRQKQHLTMETNNSHSREEDYNAT